MKLMEIQVNCTENNEEYNIIKIAEGMKQAEEITIEKYYNKEIALIKEGVTENTTNLEGIVVSVNEYSEYKFLIGENCKIIGVIEGEVTETTNKEDFIDIEEFERNVLQGESEPILNTKITYEPNGYYTNKDIAVGVVVKISNSKGIKSIKCPDNDIIYPQKDQTEVGIDYTVTKNESYTYVVTDSEGKEETVTIKVDIFDKVEPKDFTPIEIEAKASSVIIKGNAEDGDETEESAKSGIAKYEYYAEGPSGSNLRKHGETTEEEFEITGLEINTNYTLYLIAYDRAGNKKKSQEITVTPKNIIYIYNLEELKEFRDNVNNGESYEGAVVHLMADIDLGCKEDDESTWWIPIGISGFGFRGNFNGNGHVIRNLYINSNLNNIGFFGIAYNISGLRIIDAKIIVNNNSAYVGVIAGCARGESIVDCITSGELIGGTSGRIGGVIGITLEATSNGAATIKNCGSSTNIYGGHETRRNFGMELL